MATKFSKNTVSVLVAFTLMCTSIFSIGDATNAEAAKKASLKTKKISVTVGKTKKITIKKVKKCSYLFKSKNKKIATVTKKGVVKGKKAGKTTIVITEKNKKKVKRLGTVKVTVTAKKKPTPSKTPAQTPLDKPSAQPTATQTAAPQNNGNTATPPVTTPDPGPTGQPAPVERNPQNILEAYKDIFPYLGNCLNYTASQLKNEETMSFVKDNYNSFTLENEMKPDSVLGGSATKISKQDALDKGYIIPENYTEEYVPQLNFSTLDEVLKTAYDNGLKMRAHTLVWHSQTPQWFFTESYDGSTLVDITTMDARLEFYVATVMSHIMEKEKEIAGEAGSIVYAWDITNEYLHHQYAGGAKTWTSIYQDLGTDELQPPYVKKAFEVAYAQLEAYNVQDKVTLFYNDFDTYFNVDEVVSLVDYINEGETDQSGNPVNICGGIGMQSHLDVDRPTLDEYGAALDRFMATGLEVQITELDVTINWNHKTTYTYQNEKQTNEDQAAFIADLMKLIITKQKNRDTAISPKGITSLTIWGLSDSVSWRGAFQSGGNSQPTLFGDGIDDPKPSYTEFLKASDIWYES